MMTYNDYCQAGGRIEEFEFNELIPLVTISINSYISTLIPKWFIKNSIEEYELDNLDFILKIQIDFISSCGGLNAMMGKSDFDITSVSISGISMNIGNVSKSIQYHDGVPIAPFVYTTLIKELRKKGYLDLAVW